MKLEKSDPESDNILMLMKESKVFWSVKRELVSLLLKNKEATPSLEELQRSLLLTNNQDKLSGIINNCLQKSTRRIPI